MTKSSFSSSRLVAVTFQPFTIVKTNVVLTLFVPLTDISMAARSRRERAEGETIASKSEKYYKTTLCAMFMQGRCRKGKRCTYAHGVNELRSLGYFPGQQSHSNYNNKQKSKKSSKSCKKLS